MTPFQTPSKALISTDGSTFLPLVTAGPGSWGSYGLYVTNTGGTPAINVVYSGVLPSNIDWIGRGNDLGMSCSDGWSDPIGGVSMLTVSCTVPTLAPGVTLGVYPQGRVQGPLADATCLDSTATLDSVNGTTVEGSSTAHLTFDCSAQVKPDLPTTTDGACLRAKSNTIATPTCPWPFACPCTRHGGSRRGHRRR